MKQPAKLAIVAIILCAGLFAALWKASAPARMKRQFEQQATAQLRGATPLFKGQFENIAVRDFRYNKETDRLDLQYTMSWFISNSPYKNSSLVMSYRCSLPRSQGGFSGSCSPGIPMKNNTISKFSVSLHE